MRLHEYSFDYQNRKQCERLVPNLEKMSLTKSSIKDVNKALERLYCEFFEQEPCLDGEY